MSGLAELIAIAKEIPESHLEEALAMMRELKKKADAESENEADAVCPHCDSASVVRNGKKCGKQAYLCRNCGKSFVATTKSPIENSRSGATVWKQVISDTVEGISIDKTAERLALSHATVFNMRHKILYAIERSLIETPVTLIGVCETDETYVPESVKGRKIPQNYHRKARSHGAVAAKRGISEEYICVCASVNGEGKSMAVAINRASPGGNEILDVFGDRVEESTVVLCDGKQSYNAPEGKCTVAVTKRINKVNGLHSFIKQKLGAMRGVATVYLNRYNAFLSKIYAADQSVIDDIFHMMVARNGKVVSIAVSQSDNLLSL
jgi:transposase-like protein